MERAYSVPSSDVVNDRYQIESWVGEGGMATVYRALDLASGARVALKRLTGKRARSLATLRTLFEREFLVLSQLSHPRIVAAYDYGLHADVPYYTMELLDGSDLQRMAPVSYRAACAFGRDVCSALALVHSRRMVYRDLSPHNVRCTTDGLAKLIDFGALAPMGPREDLVGTLPCVAPEVLARKPLDARTDLYAFGATLYYTLVRRHAYPAHQVEELSELWKQRPPLPSELVPAIPRALDVLVMDLLAPDPGQRPQSAAEVMERLRAIGELEVDESLEVKSAYLSRPALVGREQALQTFHEHAQRAAERQGSALRIVGGSGSGLSRLLESCALEAKLSGWLVLRADANAEGTGDYAGAAALGRALLQESPRLARTHAEPHLAALGGIIPELLAGRDDVGVETYESPEARHRRVQPALRAWLMRVAEDRPLLMAIDDVQRLDGPSAACVALLAREARHQRMLVIFSQANDQPVPAHNQGALRLLTKLGESLMLEPLAPELTQSLIGSVFGDVPNLELVTRYVHQLTRGNPRDVMALCRHLVTEGTVRYEAGSWSLPSRLSAADLPPSMADALRLRVQKLSVRARTLAYAISREPTLSFSRADVELLLPDATSAELGRALQEAVTAEILTSHADTYRCVQRSWLVPLAEAVTESEARAAHLGLAQLFLVRDDGFRHACSLLRGGEHDQGLSAMAAFAVASCAKTNQSAMAFHALLQVLPEDWLQKCEEALALYQHYQRPARERFALLTRMSGIIARLGYEIEPFAHLVTLFAQLTHDGGLDDFAGLGADLPPVQRVQQALALAKQRYLAADEHTRVFDPGTALPELVKASLTALGVVATTSNYAAFRALPSLVPLLPLAPSFQLVHRLTQGVGHRLAARSEDALSVYGELLERLDQPDRAGLDPSHHFHAKTRVMGSMGTLEATMARASCLHWAEQVDGAPGYEHVGAVTRYLYELWQGKPREARAFRRRFELLQLETNAYMDMQHVFSELCVYALVSDMTGVRRAVDALESLAPTNSAARAGVHYGRGEYHFIRGDLPAALRELGQALALMAPGEHLIWANAAGAHVRVLMALERHVEARALGEQYLAAAEAAHLGYVQNFIRCPLSLALSKVGEHEHAIGLAHAAVAVCDMLQLGGLHAELARETAVLVALAAGDQTEVQRSLPQCSAQFRLALTRRLEGRQRRISAEPPADRSSAFSTDDDLETAFATCMVDCSTVTERAHAGLGFMLRHLKAKSGVVYLRSGEQLVCVAAEGQVDEPALRAWTLRQLEREEAAQATELIAPLAAPGEEASEELEDTSDSSSAEKLASYVPIPLAHYDETGFALTGIMALRGTLPSQVRDAVKLGAELSRSLRDAGLKSPSES